MFRNLLVPSSPIQKILSISNNVLVQSVRTTFILKRRYQPLLHKENHKPKKLRAKHYIYDLVEDTLVQKRKNVEVILKTYVEGVGKKGELVSLKPNFAYNKLILPGLADFNTEENLKKYSTEDDKEDELHSSPYAQRTVNNLERLTLAVVMSKDNPWTIEPWHIRASLRRAGFYCQDECIQLPEKPITGPDLTKDPEEFRVIITVNNLEKANLRCLIRYWRTTVPSEDSLKKVE